MKYDIIIIGSGPSGLGSAFEIAQNSELKVAIFDKSKVSSGGLRNDCKQNYTYPVGFPKELWIKEEADRLLEKTAEILKPEYESKKNIAMYLARAERLGVDLLDIKQSHVGTDCSIALINNLINELKKLSVDIYFEKEVNSIDYEKHQIVLQDKSTYQFKKLIIGPGRAGFKWLQNVMNNLGVKFIDNNVDIGVRIETKKKYYPIVEDYYDPKFLFKNKVRTFCTNSGSAHVVQEKYENYYSVNGHSFSKSNKPNNLVNFAVLKTILLTDPVVSGQQFADILGQMAMKLSGGRPMMQRVGDFRLGNRSKHETFNTDLYDFKPTFPASTPGDISLAIPAKIMRHIWSALKQLDTIVPGILHPSTIIYYPEIKTYANKPEFINKDFEVIEDVYMIGDGAGTSRGITAAWSSGIRAAENILGKI